MGNYQNNKSKFERMMEKFIKSSKDKQKELNKRKHTKGEKKKYKQDAADKRKEFQKQ